MRYDRRRYSQWAPYVPVAERRRAAEKHILALKKKGAVLNPIVIEGRSIAKTFWGKAWCNNLEAYSDFENRLPRGRTYVRNGSVIDLRVAKGKVEAQVMGSSLYRVEITIRPMAQDRWEALVKTCSGKIDSLIELLQGKFSKAVMEILTEEENGLFPKPREIEMRCSCPDHAGMCKHIAATLYGVGACLDEKPESLFVIRHVDHLDLIASASTSDILAPAQLATDGLAESDLSSMFGIEIDAGAAVVKSISRTASSLVSASEILGKKTSSRNKKSTVKGKKTPQCTSSKQREEKPSKMARKRNNKTSTLNAKSPLKKSRKDNVAERERR